MWPLLNEEHHIVVIKHVSVPIRAVLLEISSDFSVGRQLQIHVVEQGPSFKSH